MVESFQVLQGGWIIERGKRPGYQDPSFAHGQDKECQPRINAQSLVPMMLSGWYPCFH